MQERDYCSTVKCNVISAGDQPTCPTGTDLPCCRCEDTIDHPLKQFIAKSATLSFITSTRARITGGLVFLAAAFILKDYATLSFFLFLTSYLVVGTGVIIQALLGLTRGKVFSEHFLMSIATIGAFIIGEYAEGCVVMVLYLIGEELEHRAVDRTRRSITSLAAIRPDIAHLVIDEVVSDQPPASVSPGDQILVYPGERVPLDGKLLSDSATLNYSALTGESQPVVVSMGEEIMAGAINGQTLLSLTVLRDEQHSAVIRIMQLAEQAGHKKTRVETFTERFARYYTPVVVFMALAIAFLPSLLISGQDLNVWVYRALHFLVISCPCALVISVPLAFIAGIGNASRHGVFIRGSQYLEALTNIETAVFDKTGTLTTGRFEITNIVTAPGITADQVIEIAAMVEQHSTHPIAEAICRSFNVRSKNNSRPLPVITSPTEEIPGHGMVAEIDGNQVLVGNIKLMNSRKVDMGNAGEISSASTLIHVARGGNWIGALYADDALRSSAKHSIERLRDQGTTKIAILSGDREQAVARVGSELGADVIYAGLLPEDKIERYEKLRQSAHGRTIFVGDGINDAPVLRLADVGVAIGGLGSDAAIEAADVIIMTDELERIPDAVDIARRTKRRVYENLAIILIVKGALLTLGALGITPLWGAVFADTGVMLIAVLNSLRAYSTQRLT